MTNQYPVCEHCGTRHKQCLPSTVEKEGLEYIETHSREQELFIPERLDGLNEIIGAARTHWSVAAKQKSSTEEMIGWAIKACKLQPITGPFKMEIHYSEPNEKRDPDNILSAKKFIMDALKTMGIIPDDSQKYVKGFSESWGLTSETKPVGVYIKLIED